MDLVVIGLLMVAAAWGGITGFVSQSISLVGIVLGLAAGGALALWLSERIFNPDVRATVAILCVFVVVGLFYVGAATIGAHVKRKVPHGWVRGVDAMTGTIMAMVGVALAVWLMAVPLAESPFETVSSGMKDSLTMRIVRSSPPPSQFLASFRSALKASGFPTVFENLPGPIGGSIAPPDAAIASDPDVEAVGASTVKLLADSCGTGSEGSGWVYAPEYVATNAHVVAGSSGDVEVETRQGREHDGTVVAFDPDRDVAVLHVPGLKVAPVQYSELEAERGLSVAALGYPDNGPYTATPGRITQKLSARGRDIYDERIVERQIYEVGTRIRPGNSGGPLVSPNGLVHGIVFAASSTDNDIGYALTGYEVAAVLEPAVGATAGIGTGACLS